MALRTTLDEQRTGQDELHGLQAEIAGLREQLTQEQTNVEALKLACNVSTTTIHLPCIHRKYKCSGP